MDRFGLLLWAGSLSVLTWILPPHLIAEPPLDRDESLLRGAGIRTDTNSLREQLRPRPVVVADARRVEALIRQLGSEHYTEREQAAKELMGVGRPALPDLERARASGDAEVATRAKECIIDIEARTNPEYLGAEVRLLARQRPEGVVKMLLGLLGHPDATARKWAYDSLVQVAGPGDFDDVLKAIQDKQPEVRAGAIGLSYKYPEKSKVLAPLLLEAVRDKDAGVRYRAASFLGRFGAEEGVVEALTEALKDTEEAPPWGQSVAAAAVDSLGQLKERAKPALKAMMEMSKSGGIRDRRLATLALGNLARNEKSFVQEVVPFLILLLEDTNQPTGNRARAAHALSVIGSQADSAVPALRSALKAEDAKPDPGDRVRIHGCVLVALREIGPGAKDAVPELLEILVNKKQDGWNRQCAAEALGNIGPAANAAVPVLTAFLETKALTPEDSVLKPVVKSALDKIEQ